MKVFRKSKKNFGLLVSLRSINANLTASDAINKCDKIWKKLSLLLYTTYREKTGQHDNSNS